ncbi:hypothetical protein [Hyphococcus sp.]|uniref:hypothetical protein n=1 Tax=Hyphococcus sp. TaxID=2038636 RepID=UPI003CCBEBB0
MSQMPPDLRSDRLIARKLTDSPGSVPMALGCPSCRHFDICGGLSIEEGVLDCLAFCCGKSESCSLVCRKKAELFAQQVREIDGFEFDNVARTPTVAVNFNDEIVPLVYHGSSRAKALSYGIMALRLADLINFRTGRLRFETRAELCKAFRIEEAATLILTGVDQDHRIEPWWALGEKRLGIIEQLRQIGVALVTAPNFSVFINHPRTDDLHAMKRIALVFAEFQLGGIACALHAHGRTERDFSRWAFFIRERPEIQILSYEFITGSATKARRRFHLEQLAMIAKMAGRDLDIIIRGKPDVIPFLRKLFRRVIYIESGTFVKTINRQRAERVGNRNLTWATMPTDMGAPVDALFQHNARERIAYLHNRFYTDPEPDPVSRAA